jgi:hypothetical protein
MSKGLSGDRHESWLDGLHSSRNWLGFALRNFLRWEPGVYCEPTESKETLFAEDPGTAQKETALIKRYSLEPLVQHTSRQRYCEILAYLEWLDYGFQFAPNTFLQLSSTEERLHWLDVGAKNWAYVEALYAFIATCQNGKPFRLNGIELDPNRRYISLKTRRQAAISYTQPLPWAHYHAGNLLDWREKTHIISHFLPFVFKEPLLAWGLPLAHFKPEALLAHQLSLLAPKGILLIVNQGEAEAEAQQGLLAQAAKEWPIGFESLGQLPASFIQYRYPRYGWICVNEGS